MTDDERLRALLHDAVADVEPRDGLAEIRRRTRRPRPSRARRWWPVMLGAGVATAAVVGGAVVVADVVGDDPASDEPAASAPTDTSGDETRATAVYFLGDTPTGPRLYREFQRLPAVEGEERVELALSRLPGPVTPDDPDYWSVWPAGSFGDVELADDRVVVELASERALQVPGRAAPEEQRLGVQQVVYTVEAAIGETLPVAFEHDGQPATEVLGYDVGELVERDRQHDVTAPVNISDPVEGQVVEHSFVATGSAAADVAEVEWFVTTPDWRPDGGRLVQRVAGSATVGDPTTGTLGAPGWRADPVDVDVLEPGRYLFVVRTQATGQTSDAPVTFFDTRTIQVR